MTGRVRVLIADDHAATRLGVRRALEHNEFDVIAEAADGPTAVRQALELRPDLCLLDVHMPGGGNEAAAAIADALPETRVVMLTVSDSDDDLFAALRAGACGYLLKETDPERLPFALRGALAGEAPLPRALTARLIGEFRRSEQRRESLAVAGRDVELSVRERQVLELMREGFSTRAIGERLTVSPVTVRRHVQTILRKLEVPSRREALALLEADPVQIRPARAA